jgi:hypothetical protein
VAVPLFMFLYLKPHSKEGWGISLVLTGFAWAVFYGLFIKLLNVPFGQGWVQMGLKALGVL